MAPEILQDNSNKKTIVSYKSDIWSLGISLFCFIYLKLPFNGKNIINIIKNIRKEKYYK